jgi:hypothetical protein
MKRESNEIVAAQKALDGVWGVDINPFAVAIARFRLIVAAIRACGIKNLKRGHAPGWKIHLAAGDSLLFGSKPGYKGERVRLHRQGNLFEVPAIYAVEEAKVVDEILDQGYHVVVGNPPYIIVRDKSQNSAYRALYSTCHQKFSLGVPFTQRFWELAIQPGEVNGGCGYIGMITTNAFMKREFGKKLIEEFFPKIDLTHVVDTSGAYIPGHGTPTVILFGRSRNPVGDTVRAVLGIKGEATAPEDASQGFVWRSIIKQIDAANSQDEYTSTVDVPRTTFNTHPWSIGGGGAAELKAQLEEDRRTLSEDIDSIGFMAITGEDDAYVRLAHEWKHAACPTRKFVEGDCIKDWCVSTDLAAPFMYEIGNNSVQLLALDEFKGLNRELWNLRTNLRNRLMFGKYPDESGIAWYEYRFKSDRRICAPLSIAFREIATHNDFVLDRGEKVFKHSAQVINLPAAASEQDHLALLGLLNSSTACFWTKQTCHDKGGGGIGGGLATEFWEHFFDYTGTKLERFPVTEVRPVALAHKLDILGDRYIQLLPGASARVDTPAAAEIKEARKQAESIRRKMIALQEELDWQCYQLYALLPDDLRYTGDDLPEIAFGERAFEIVMARQIAEGELQTTWFERHGSKAITDLPKHWPASYRKLVERRIKLIETNKEIGLIERPEYKRRWNAEPWEEQEQRALKNWLLDRLEDKRYWLRIELQSTAQLADRASADAEFMQVAALYRGRADFDLAALVAELIEGESVPFLPILRYKASGLRKREVWERTWDLQRQEDDLTWQRATIEEGLRQIHSRIVRSFFAAEQKAVDEMEDELKKRCIEARKKHAPTVTFEGSWSGTRMVLELESGGITTAQGALVLQGLVETKKEMAHRKHVRDVKVAEKCESDAEYKAKHLELMAIPDDPEIPVPPKYATADFQKTDYWRLRGKLDVPKERWISYPHCQAVSDPTLVVGWAGWNHLEQATAIVTYYDARKREGWDAKRLTLLLAGLQQLLPWIHQWHPEIDKESGKTAGQDYQSMVEQDAYELGLTLEDIRTWQPPQTTARRSKTKKVASKPIAVKGGN